MKFAIEREYLLKPLQQVSSLLVGRPMLPILANLLLQVIDGKLLITGSDLEIEVVAQITLSQPYDKGEITVSGRKFFDICRNLASTANISVQLKDDRILIYSGYSYFSLSTLPALDFPVLNKWQSVIEFTIPQETIKRLIEATQFSMAQQDVRYYLNGMLLETEGNEIRSVATDGHRLAICYIKISDSLPKSSIIIPRKGILELTRILASCGNVPTCVQIGNNNIRVHIGDFIFTSKLLDGYFPDYRRVLPRNPNKKLEAGCDMLKQAFIRVSAIISNEKFRTIRLYASKKQVKITAKNQEQERAEEILDNITYTGSEIEIGFNANYVLDILNALKCEDVRILLTDPISSVQIEDPKSQLALYVVMPIRL